jgi:predicted MFS family arabinose efflux permease
LPIELSYDSFEKRKKRRTTMLLFLMILAIVALAIFTSLKIAFLIFLGIVAVGIIVVAMLVGSFIHMSGEGDDDHGPMDKILFGDE